jgi:hypothetical protein
VEPGGRCVCGMPSCAGGGLQEYKECRSLRRGESLVTTKSEGRRNVLG